MKVHDVYQSPYIKPAELAGRTMKATIQRVTLDTFEYNSRKTKKLVCWFAMTDGKLRGVPLNQTNADILADLLGDESDEWKGKQINVYAEIASVGGKEVSVFRVSVPDKKE